MKTNDPGKRSFADALKISDIRFFIGYIAFFTLGARAVTVVLGFQIYQLTHSPFALGLLGLVEAIPALSLFLIGGYVADHVNRKLILVITASIACLCALMLALLSDPSRPPQVVGLYLVIFAAGVARAFADPATTAIEAQIVPKALTVNAGSWISSTWLICSVLGPGAIGFMYDAGGPRLSYAAVLLCFVISCFFLAGLKPVPAPAATVKEPILDSIAAGWKFVFTHQPFIGALALDLFAVLFGGMIALLPIYADQILHTGAKGLGLLNAAPSLGALVTMLIATQHPPIHRAGRNLLAAVSGFGISVLIFAFSKNFYLSITALFMSGVFDGVSVVIRRSMLRLLSPDDIRGRIAAANWIFITASNELGAFESGLVAAWIGTVPCVAVGGLLTLLVVSMTAWLAPELRQLRFNIRTMERESGA